MNTNLSYRPDIDGLRALAVLSVVLFHLGGTPLHGGYAGVDIFFVISGYLITSIIDRDMALGHFSIAAFYERRIRRILPALFAVMTATLVASTFILFPPDFEYFGEGLAATAGFGSNFLFWQKSGYFEADALTVPLLHTWSLAVEEQFYIFFPLFLLAVHKFAPSLLRILVVAGIVISLILSVFLIRTESSAALFYLLPPRAAELLIGSALSLFKWPSLRGKFADAIGVIGLALIGYAVFAFNQDTIFPGPNALMPCLGAALIIYAGMNGEGVCRRYLGSRLPVFIGLMSYSLYLWHWPVIVFYHYISPVESTPLVAIALFGVSMALAWFSWKYIETPLRYIGWSRGKIFIAAFACTMLFIGLGLVIAQQKGFPDRFSPAIQSLYKLTSGKALPPVADGPANSYNRVMGDEKAKASFIVWGDSHAEAASPGIDKAARTMGKKGYLLGVHSCPPSYMDSPSPIERCNEVNRGIVAFIKAHPEIKTVILIGHWSIHEIRYAREYRLGKIQSPTLFLDTLDSVFTGLEKDGRKIVFMIEMPHAPVSNVPLAMARAEYFGFDLPLSYDLTVQQKRQKGVDEALAQLAQTHKITIVDPRDVFCPQGVCAIGEKGHPYFRDDSHLTVYGSELFSEMYAPLLK